MAIALVARRTNRYLWKVVQLANGCWCVPTKRLVTAMLMTRQVGFPENILRLRKAAEEGLKGLNRIPFEIPEEALVALCPFELTLYYRPATLLEDSGILVPYLDRFGQEGLFQRIGFDQQQMEPAFEERLNADTDLLDKYRGDPFEARKSLPEVMQHFAAVVDAADHYGGFPVILESELCERFLAANGRPTHKLVRLERKLRERMPDNVLTFDDLLSPAFFEAADSVQGLVHDLMHSDSSIASTDAWEEVLASTCSELSKLGTTYTSLVLGWVTALPSEALPETILEYRPDPNQLAKVLGNASVMLHKSAAISDCLEGKPFTAGLLMVYSDCLWTQSLMMNDLMRAASGFPFARQDVAIARMPVS